MQLYLSVEGQNCTEIGLSKVLAETRNVLSSLLNKQNGINSKYGAEFVLLTIIPTCVDDQTWQTLGWSERILLKRKRKEADIRLRINYEKFINADETQKKHIFIDIIKKSIHAIQERSKGDFNGNQLIHDIEELTKGTN